MATSELTYRGGHDAQPQAGAGARAAAENKPRSNKPTSSTTALRYVLGEQRLAFALVGMAIATVLFLLLSPAATTPISTAASSGSSVASLAAVGVVSRQFSGGAARLAYEHQQSGRLPAAGGRVPLGLKRKTLRVVVTGGAGFVGSHLVDRLLARGDSVIVVDNFFTGRKENVAHHAGNPNFEMIRHDVVEPILLEVDQIYHLACPASPVHYKYNPVKTIKTNVVGTLNMLGLAKRVGARFLLTSTSEVYGDPLQHPQVETYWGNVNPIGTP
jgi:UDP-glucuronate decarboxylase